jgi:FixJ family two-component response regulator
MRAGRLLPPSTFPREPWQNRDSPGVLSRRWPALIDELSCYLRRPSPMTNEQSRQQPVVFVIDDDVSLRQAVGRLIRSVDLQVVLLASAREFLAQTLPNAPCCLVLDVRLPGLSGLDIQAELAKARIQIPIIFMTGHGDIPMSVRAMKAGALEFLTKPFREQDLLDAIQLALERDKERVERDKAISSLSAKFETLSPREQEVMAWVTAGLLNKQIAGEIGITENTVKVHRGNVIKKMGAKSLAELVRMADMLGVRRPRS